MICQSGGMTIQTIKFIPEDDDTSPPSDYNV